MKKYSLVFSLTALISFGAVPISLAQTSSTPDANATGNNPGGFTQPYGHSGDSSLPSGSSTGPANAPLGPSSMSGATTGGSSDSTRPNSPNYPYPNSSPMTPNQPYSPLTPNPSDVSNPMR